MDTPHTDEPALRKPLRLWPGVAAVVLQWLVWVVVPSVVPDANFIAVLGRLAGDGAGVWSRNVATDTGTNVPTWGFSASPLVVDDSVIAAAAGKLAAYDISTGEPHVEGQTLRQRPVGAVA